MPALIAFIIFIAVALLAGAAFAYPMHILLANWFELDFERVLSRSVLIIAILLFLAFFKIIGFRTWQEIGYSSNKKEFWNDLIKGFGTGLLILSPVVAGLLITKTRVLDLNWDVSLSSISSLLISAFVAGLVIAILEETLFRGAMLTAIQRQSSKWFAITASSLVYALMHFLQPATHLDASTLNWSSGFIVLKSAFLPIFQPMQIIDSCIALFLAGMLLALVKIRTNKLAICIGIHMGWVFTIKVFKRVTDSNIYSEYAFLVGSYDKVIGYLAAICIAVTIVVYLKLQDQPEMSQK